MRGKGEWRATDSNTTMALIDTARPRYIYSLHSTPDINSIMGSNTRPHQEGEYREIIRGCDTMTSMGHTETLTKREREGKQERERE